MAEIELRDITKIYEIPGRQRKVPPLKVYALENICLRIEKQEFVVLMGASGSGKSTLLRIVAGLEEQTSGQVFLYDRLADDLAPSQRELSFVFQEYALYPQKTAFENMAFPLVNMGVKKERIRELVIEAARMLQIEYLLNRRPKQMSWGQRQRIALGRAICRKPKILLLDEPLSGADEALRQELIPTLLKLHKALEMTCLYVTHNQQEAEALGDRIVYLDEGRLK